jgi:hypothetical protein
MSAKKMSHPNEGIKCIVDTCSYYMPGNYCCADKIEVKAIDASTSNQTDCATFIPESGR